MLKAASHTKLEAGAPLHQLYVQLSTNSVRGASEGQQCDCVVGRAEHAGADCNHYRRIFQEHRFACEFVGKVP